MKTLANRGSAVIWGIVICCAMAGPGTHAGELKPISQGEIDELEAKEDNLAEYHIRMLATILWRYRWDTGGFPSSSGALVPVSELTEQLVPRLAPRLFGRDPWCGTYLYWSDGVGNFLIVSPGRDGQVSPRICCG